MIENYRGFMAFTAAGITRKLHDYGVQTEKYEESCKEIINKLIQIRAQIVINYADEADQISSLENLEKEKNQSTSKTSYELGNKTVKLCAGPVAGIASSIVTSTLKKQGEGSEDLVIDLAESALEVGVDQIEKEATKEIYDATSQWAFGVAADWLGIAVETATVAFAPLTVGVAGLACATACAMSPTVRETCVNYVSETVKGAGALFFEVFSKGKIPKIIDSYKLWNHTWTEYEDEKASYFQKVADMENERYLLRLQETNLAATKAQIKERRKKLFNRFVSVIRNSDFLTQVFSSISKSFEKEKNIQNNLKAEKKNGRIKLEAQRNLIMTSNDEVVQLFDKLILKKIVVDNLEIEYSNHLA